MLQEILFVNPGIPDLGVFLSGLRPGLKAVLLSPKRPVPAQIADALQLCGTPVGGHQLLSVNSASHHSHLCGGGFPSEGRSKNACAYRQRGCPAV